MIHILKYIYRYKCTWIDKHIERLKHVWYKSRYTERQILLQIRNDKHQCRYKYTYLDKYIYQQKYRYNDKQVHIHLTYTGSRTDTDTDTHTDTAHTHTHTQTLHTHTHTQTLHTHTHTQSTLSACPFFNLSICHVFPSVIYLSINPPIHQFVFLSACTCLRATLELLNTPRLYWIFSRARVCVCVCVCWGGGAPETAFMLAIQATVGIN